MSVDRILVPVDGSEASFRAVEFANTLADASLAKVEVVTVLDLGQLDVYDGFYMNQEQLETWQEHVRNDILEQAKQRSEGALELPALTLLRGSVVPAILAHAREVGADLIVVGRTGRGSVDRLFNGSVSLSLSRNASIPVAMVP